jgi:peptide/nickel transport system substrate-binding protein
LIGISTRAKRPRVRGLSLQAKDLFTYPVRRTVFAPISRQLLVVAFFGLIAPACLAEAHTKALADCGTIIFPPLSDITSFNPLFADTTSNTEAGQVMFMDLVWINRFGRIDWARSLASAIQVSDHGQVYSITLRPWRWSDGVAVTSADVVYDFSLIKKFGAAATGAGAGGMPGIIKTMTATDSNHLTITLTQQVNPTWFVLNALVELYPLPAHAWSHYTLDEIFQAQTTPSFFNPVDGPLELQKFDYGYDALFTPNPSYPGPKMHFSRFVFKFIETDGESVDQVKAGDVDLVQLPPEFWNRERNLPGIHVEQLSPSDSSYLLALNFQNPQVAFFRDVRVRQAMQDAQDQLSLIKTVLHGFGAPVYTAVPPGENEFLDPQLAAQHYPVGYNPAKARALLNESGYTPGSDGIMQKGGQRLEFTDLMAAGSDELTEMTEFIQANLLQAGIRMDVKVTDDTELNALIYGNPTGWQASLFGFAPSDFPSGDSQYLSGNGNNFEGYSDPQMDRRIEESINRPGLAGLHDYERYASFQQPSIFSVELTPVYLVRDRLHGVNDFIDPAGQLSPDQLTCTDNREK